MKSISEKISLGSAAFLVVFGLIFFWAFPATGEEWTAEQKEVWDAVLADYENFKTANLEEIMAVRHDKVAIWWSSKPVPYDKKNA